MSSSFGAAVAQWHDFYAMSGGAAAALLGLLFTSMALRSGQAGSAGLAAERDLWAAASVPFACFLDILLLSLAFLAPGQSEVGLGVPLLSLAMLATALFRWVDAREWVLPAIRWRWRLLAVLGCYLAQAAAAIAIFIGHPELLWLQAVAVGGLVVFASVVAWGLMREPILAQARRPGPPRADASHQGDRADDEQSLPP